MKPKYKIGEVIITEACGECKIIDVARFYVINAWVYHVRTEEDYSHLTFLEEDLV